MVTILWIFKFWTCKLSSDYPFLTLMPEILLLQCNLNFFFTGIQCKRRPISSGFQSPEFYCKNDQCWKLTLHQYYCCYYFYLNFFFIISKCPWCCCSLCIRVLVVSLRLTFNSLMAVIAHHLAFEWFLGPSINTLQHTVALSWNFEQCIGQI